MDPLKDIPDVLKGKSAYVVKRMLLTRDLIKGSTPGILLDIGCGGGTLFSLIGPDVEMHGVDLSERATGMPRQVHPPSPETTGMPVEEGENDGTASADSARHVGRMNPAKLQHESFGAKTGHLKGTTRMRVGLHYKQADISKGLPYEDGMFDIVTGSEVIEHLNDTALFLGECFRILKKGGKLILSTPNLHYWRNMIEWFKGNQYYYVDYHDGQEGHVRYFCPKTFSEMVQQAGFRNVHVVTAGDVGTDNFLLKLAVGYFEKFSRNKNCIIVLSADKE